MNMADPGRTGSEKATAQSRIFYKNTSTQLGYGQKLAVTVRIDVLF